MISKGKILVAVSALALAGGAFAAPPSFDGTYTGTDTSVDSAVANAVSTVTGSASTAPNLVTTTTVGQVTTTTTSAPAAPITDTVTVNGTTFGTTLDFDATGTSVSDVTTVRLDTFDPATLLITSTSTSSSSVPVAGSGVVTGLSVSGFGGDADANGTVTYGSTLSTSGTPSAAGAVAATEKSIVVTSSGATFSTYTGTATYNPGTGEVDVSTPTLASQTSVTSTGLVTTGTVGASGTVSGNVGGVAGATAFDANGGKLTNLAAGTAATDAVNKGQLDAAVASIGGNITAGLRDARKRAEAGTAVAVALSGATFLPNHKFNLTANVGTYEGATAVAGQLGVLVTDNIALNAGVATSFGSYGGTAARGGITFGF